MVRYNSSLFFRKAQNHSRLRPVGYAGQARHEREKEMCKLRIDRVLNHMNGFCLLRK